MVLMEIQLYLIHQYHHHTKGIMIRRFIISGSDLTNATNALNNVPQLSASFHSTSNTDDSNLIYFDIEFETIYTMPHIHKCVAKVCGYSPKDLKNLTE